MKGNKDLGKYLDATVTVTQTETGCLSIRDKGVFIFQHDLLKPEVSADPNVAVDETVTLDPSADKLVIVVHGWMDKGQDSWPSEMAAVARTSEGASSSATTASRRPRRASSR